VTAALGDGGRVFFIKVLSVLDTSGGRFCEKIFATLANDGRILADGGLTNDGWGLLSIA
jgi:hypothetical protein